jgi:hypothetical protein
MEKKLLAYNPTFKQAKPWGKDVKAPEQKEAPNIAELRAIGKCFK